MATALAKRTAGQTDAYDPAAHTDDLWLTGAQSFLLVAWPACRSEYLAAFGALPQSNDECPFCKLVHRCPTDQLAQVAVLPLSGCLLHWTAAPARARCCAVRDGPAALVADDVDLLLRPSLAGDGQCKVTQRVVLPMNANSDDFQPLTVAAYAEQALTTDQRSDGASLTFPLLGLFGETGSLLSAVKKKQRDRASYSGYAEAVVEEFGDVLWYVTTVAARGGLRLEDIMAAALPAPAGDAPELMSSLQPAIMQLRGEPTAAFEDTLLRLAGEVGVLLIDHRQGRLSDRRTLHDRLVTITRGLIQAATEAGVTLEAAAVKNLVKIFDRWPRVRVYPDALDAKAEWDEQLPRSLSVDIYERDVRGQTYVFQRCQGLNIGDRLTDNAMEADAIVSTMSSTSRIWRY